MKHRTAPITIRLAAPDDRIALARLAALDSAEELPSGKVLLAEIDGELRAALSVRDGAAVADPFYPTADIIALLRGYLESIERPDVGRRRWSAYAAALAARPASALAGRS